MKNKILIYLKTLQIIAIAVFCFLTMFFQFLDFAIFGKNRIYKFLEDNFFKLQFQITDLKRKL